MRSYAMIHDPVMKIKHKGICWHSRNTRGCLEKGHHPSFGRFQQGGKQTKSFVKLGQLWRDSLRRGLACRCGCRDWSLPGSSWKMIIPFRTITSKRSQLFTWLQTHRLHCGAARGTFLNRSVDPQLFCWKWHKSFLWANFYDLSPVSWYHASRWLDGVIKLLAAISQISKKVHVSRWCLGQKLLNLLHST